MRIGEEPHQVHWEEPPPPEGREGGVVACGEGDERVGTEEPWRVSYCARD
jgi:hypothetical protein